MPINISAPELRELKPRIIVLGVGGAGGNAINNMINQGVVGVEYVAANTDAQDLKNNLADCKIQLGSNLTRGLGAGSKAEIGRAAADESMNEIINLLQGANMVFITAGMGGGTGTGAAPIIAKAAKDLNILTFAIVTKPFMFEGPGRIRVAEKGLEELKNYVDTSIIIPNQNLFKIADDKTTYTDAFKMADNVLLHGVRGVTDLITKPGQMNLDFADIETISTGMGKAMMGTGEAEGQDRANIATQMAIHNPLIDDYSLKGAKGLLVNISGGEDITLYEVQECSNQIRAEVDPAADVMIGTTIDENLKGKLRVSIVATGLGGEVNRNKPVLVHNRNYINPNLRGNATNYTHNPYMVNNSQNNYSRPMNTVMSGSAAIDMNSVTHNSNLDNNMEKENEKINGKINNTTNIKNDRNINNFFDDSSYDEKQHSLDLDNQVDDSPKLFSEDTDVSFNDDISYNYDESIKKHESESNNEIDKDLSDLSFDDKDDLEIPAFLRRQTN